MTKQSLLILTAVGFVFAIASSALVFATLDPEHNNIPASLGYLFLGMIAAAIAARALLGRGETTRIGRLAVPLLSAIAFAVLSSAVTNLLIGSHAFDSLSNVAEPVSTATIIAIVIAAVIYLAAATVYGFVGTAQGVAVGSRIGLLLLLLLSIAPGANILGLLGFGITVILREPRVRAEVPVTAEVPATTETAET
jgi:hypothetical protein